MKHMRSSGQGLSSYLKGYRIFEVERGCSYSRKCKESCHILKELNRVYNVLQLALNIGIFSAALSCPPSKPAGPGCGLEPPNEATHVSCQTGEDFADGLEKKV